MVYFKSVIVISDKSVKAIEELSNFSDIYIKAYNYNLRQFEKDCKIKKVTRDTVYKALRLEYEVAGTSYKRNLVCTEDTNILTLLGKHNDIKWLRAKNMIVGTKLYSEPDELEDEGLVITKIETIEKEIDIFDIILDTTDDMGYISSGGIVIKSSL